MNTTLLAESLSYDGSEGIVYSDAAGLSYASILTTTDSESPATVVSSIRIRSVKVSVAPLFALVVTSLKT